MTSHPEVEALAFFVEDLLEPDEERSVTDHIETCALCATTIDELSGVTRVLADVPAPTMPQDVADLLDVRIREAASERAATDRPGGGRDTTRPTESGATASVTPIGRKRRGFGLPKLLMVAAASVFVIGAGSAVVGNLMSDESDMGAASRFSEDATTEDTPDTALSYSEEGVASGTVYTEDGFTTQASAVLDQAGEDDGMGVQSEESATLPQGAQECVAHVEAATDSHVTLVDDARWEGPEGTNRAWVLFTRDGEGVDVLVVDPICARGGDLDSAILAEGSL